MTITEQIHVANISCDGCVKSITRQLATLAGISDIQVNITTGIVSLTHSEIIDRKSITDKLLSIGYPEQNQQDESQPEKNNLK